MSQMRTQAPWSLKQTGARALTPPVLVLFQLQLPRVKAGGVGDGREEGGKWDTEEVVRGRQEALPFAEGLGAEAT